MSDQPYPGRSAMISVKRSANCGATRCHITWVSEKPCSSNSGGPAPPTRAKIRPDRVLIHFEARLGNKSARSDIACSLGSRGLFQRLLQLNRLPADIAPAKTLRPFYPIDRRISALPRFHDGLTGGADVEHAAAIGDELAIPHQRAGLED